MYVENLLRQDQELTVGHSQEWLFGYSTKVISVLSRLNGLGVIFEFLDQPIRKRISVNEIAQAIEGLESVDADLHRFARYLYESKSVVRQFFLNAGDDNLRFISVNEILQDQLAGDKGKLKELEAQEATLSAELTAALEDVVNASTKLLIRDLEWGLVLAVSIGIGQIEFAAAEGAVLMNVFKEKANVAIKKVSSAGEKKAAGEILQLNESHDKISSIIEQRSQALSDIAKLSVDISVLRVLIQSVFAFNSNAQQLLRSLDAVGHFIETEIGNFYTVKLLLQAGKNDAALKRFDDAMAMWKSISAASDLLQRTFNYSF